MRPSTFLVGFVVGVASAAVYYYGYSLPARDAETQRLVHEAGLAAERVAIAEYAKAGGKVATNELLGDVADLKRMGEQIAQMGEILNDALLNIEIDRAMQAMLEREAVGTGQL